MKFNEDALYFGDSITILIIFVVLHKVGAKLHQLSPPRLRGGVRGGVFDKLWLI